MTQTALTYGNALYDLALEEGKSKDFFEQLEVIDSVLNENPDFIMLLSSQTVPKQERCAILDQCFADRIHTYVLSFMKILCENGTIRQMHQCIAQYRERYYEDNDILSVCAVTAVELKEDLKNKLADKLTKVTGKTILLTTKVDEDCLGGMRLAFSGKQLDGTVRHHLTEIEKNINSLTL